MAQPEDRYAPTSPVYASIPPDTENSNEFSASLAWRILLVTAAFYAVAIVIYSLMTPLSRDIGISEAEARSMIGSNAAFLFVVCLLGYWRVFWLIFTTNKDDPSLSRRVWAAWCCITVPTGFLLWTLTDNEIPIGGNLYPIEYFMLFIGSIVISPIATLFSEINIKNSIGHGSTGREEAEVGRYVAPRLTPPEF